MLEVKYTQRFLQNLEAVFIQIHRDKPRSAKKFVEKLYELIELTRCNPSLGKECKYKNIEQNCRVLVYDKNYLILYRTYKNHITIGNIINTKQNYNKGKK